MIAAFDYAHPQYDHGSIAAQRRLPEIQGVDRLWFAGAHWGHGFHEDGLRSGLAVAAGAGCRTAVATGLVARPWPGSPADPAGSGGGGRRVTSPRRRPIPMASIVGG